MPRRGVTVESLAWGVQRGYTRLSIGANTVKSGGPHHPKTEASVSSFSTYAVILRFREG